MIFTQENEYSAVLDTCVLVPAALCDTLLRLAEEPALYRPLWSEQIMAELAKALETKLGRTQKEIAYRTQKMNEAFPEATVQVPPELLKAVECVPDKKDRHVLAAAVMASANVIVTQNTKHFPKECLDRYRVLCRSADDFLCDQFTLRREVVLEKIDDQAAGIGKKREFVVSSLSASVPRFSKLLAEHLWSYVQNTDRPAR
jgi:predicted nucleic acid-binding protein